MKITFKGQFEKFIFFFQFFLAKHLAYQKQKVINIVLIAVLKLKTSLTAFLSLSDELVSVKMGYLSGGA